MNVELSENFGVTIAVLGNVDRFPCPNNCGKVYKHAKTMRRHVRDECGDQRKFRCDYCGRSFSRNQNLRIHMGKETKLEEKKEVEEEKEEKEESFPSQQLICATFKKDENNRYVCPKCKRTYMHKCNLYKHLKYRCGTEAQFACPICERPFSHKFSLKSHTIAVHQVVFDHVILKDPVN
ncbi:hypothetical protein V9T40_010899 [Parthenolecanium corni]|uniref:C2H2-type domain-containing protein n=1 Tax=Parthenolecanium corni TaxID=536013 RepID=A0AAN9T890_9HEMI